jgi:hypothetical protein
MYYWWRNIIPGHGGIPCCCNSNGYCLITFFTQRRLGPIGGTSL